MAKRNIVPYVTFMKEATNDATWHFQLFVFRGKGGRPGFSVDRKAVPLYNDAIALAGAEVARLRAMGRSEIDPTTPFGDFARQTIDGRRKGGDPTADPISYNARNRYHVLWRNYVEPVMGKMQVKHIKSAEIVQAKIGLIEQRGAVKGGALMRNSLHGIGNLLRMVLGELCRARRFSFDELKRIRFPAGDLPLIRRVESAVFSPDQLSDAMAKMPNPLDKVRLILGVVLGLRAGEILALKWSDLQPIDDVNYYAAVRVHATVTFIAGTDGRKHTNHYQDRAKSYAGTRVVLLPRAVKPIFDAWREKQGKGDDAFIATRDGTLGNSGTIRKWFAERRSQGVLPADFTPHNMRHTYGSLFAQANGGVTALQAKLMGHSSQQVTADSYAAPVTAEAANASARFHDVVLPQLGLITVAPRTGESAV